MATGDTLMAGDAQSGQAPAGDAARLALRGDELVLSFDGSADEAICFQAVLPSIYAGGAFTVRLTWAAATATSGDTRWGVAIERRALASYDLDVNAFGPESYVTSTAAGDAGQLALATVTVSASDAGGPLVGESARVRVKRISSDAADTMAGAAELVAIEIREA